MQQQSVFEQVADAVRTLLDDVEDEWHSKAHKYGMKLWFGPVGKPTRHHYECQMLGRKHVDGKKGFAVETGWHAEHRDMAVNDELVAHLAKAEKTWRKKLGPDAELGPFFGRPDDWRRLSEVWIEPDLSDDDVVFELAGRLADYIETIEPLLPDGI